MSAVCPHTPFQRRLPSHVRRTSRPLLARIRMVLGNRPQTVDPGPTTRSSQSNTNYPKKGNIAPAPLLAGEPGLETCICFRGGLGIQLLRPASDRSDASGIRKVRVASSLQLHCDTSLTPWQPAPDTAISCVPSYDIPFSMRAQLNFPTFPGLALAYNVNYRHSTVKTLQNVVEPPHLSPVKVDVGERTPTRPGRNKQ